MTRSGSSRSWLPIAAVGVTLVLWASAFVAIRHLGPVISPGALSLGRLLVGSLVLGLLLATRTRRWPTRRDWLPLITIGVLWFGIYNVSLNAAEQRIDAGTASMLIQTSPILIAVLAVVVLHERVSPYLAPGLLLAFVGVVVISLAGSDDGGGQDVLGVVLTLVAAVVYSVSVILQKPLLGRLPALEVTWIACTVGAVACLPFAGSLVHDVQEAPASSLWWIVYLGVFPTAIAFTTWAYALTHMSAANMGATTYLVPPITIALGWLLLDEVPPVLAVLGGVLCLVGVAVARRRPRLRDVEVTVSEG
ncbi:MAG TPA: DMT family transporter [Jiangellaceae bacterium]